MFRLTPTQTRALRWLRPGTWWEPPFAYTSGLRSLARHHPDLVEVSVRQTKSGQVAEYRLTAEGEVERGVVGG